MPKCSITQYGNDYAVSTPYDRIKSDKLNSFIRARVLPEHKMPLKENGKFFWIIYHGIIESVAEQVENIFGEKLTIPALEPIDESKPRSFQLDYVGIPKGENFDKYGSKDQAFTSDRRIALGFSKGQWKIIFSEGVLKGWFEQCQTEKDSPETLFSLLLLKESASDQEIKSGYRRLARQWHTDTCKEEGAKEMMQKLNAAYEILSDENKRKRYLVGLEFERASQVPEYRSSWKPCYFIPPLKCGFLTVTGSVQVGRLKVSQILSWQDVTKEEQGLTLTMVTSWNRELNAIDYQWV